MKLQYDSKLLVSEACVAKATITDVCTDIGTQRIFLALERNIIN